MQSFAPHLAVCTIRSLCLTEATNKPRACFFFALLPQSQRPSRSIYFGTGCWTK